MLVFGDDPQLNGTHQIARYFLTILSSSNSHIRVTPSSGKYVPLGSIGLMDVLGGGFVYDPAYSLFWMQFGTNSSINWYAFDVKSEQFVFNVSDPYNFQFVHWDPMTKLIFGLGYTNDSNTLALITLNSENGTLAVVGKLDTF